MYKFKLENWNIILLNIINKIIENNKIDEAKAWVKKYFSEASDDIKLFKSIIRGIKESKLISNPIHTPNQELEEIVIKVPKNIEKRKINFDGFFIIKKKRLFFIVRVWT